MKKIISVLAMALLVIGAAQAQDQTKKMVVQLKNGQIVEFNTENVEDVTFKIVDLPEIPTTIEEAKAMLVGYWKMDLPVEEYNAEIFEGVYLVITEDLDCLLGGKVKDTFTDEDGEISPYAGKYVVTSQWGKVIFPSEEDPTFFYVGGEWTFGTNLQLNSFDINFSDSGTAYPCVRVEPFEYIIPDD